MALIRFQNVSKSFALHGGQILLRDRLVNLMRPKPRQRFYALRDVSFSLEPGESLAIVGHNGAGKSTLLNIATGLCPASSGTVEVNGRIAALLELGSGFHPDLTGAENVRVNGSLVGLTRAEVKKQFDEIVDFSGIREFINEPLRTYSSGMVMRLAFSVAINLNPDMLIIDEVLGVGDSAFFAKCQQRIHDLREAGKTLLCVSHALESVEQLCERGMWLDHGQVKQFGPVHEVLQAYREARTEAPVTVAPHR